MTGIRWRSASSSRKLTVRSSASLDQALDALASSPPTRSRARRRRAAGCGPVERVRELVQLVVHAVEHAGLVGRLEERTRVDLGDLLHPTSRPLASLDSAEKSTSPSASSTSRRWSSSVSDLRVTFSVAATVRLATSRRISSSERRVSASMSRRAAAISSSRCWVACAFDSSWSDSAALRARATMSSDCSRASFRRARYSSSSSSASSLGARGRLDRVVDRLAAPVERLGDARERRPCSARRASPRTRSASRSSPRARSR